MYKKKLSAITSLHLIRQKRFNLPQLTLNLLLITLFILPSMSADADVRKWIDKDRKAHYSDQPQPSPNGLIQLVSANVPAHLDEGALRQQRLLKLVAEDDKSQTEGQQLVSAMEPTEEEKLTTQQKTCLDARKQFAILKEQRPVYRDEQGNLHLQWKYDTYQGKREYIDDKNRASEIETVRQTIIATCENPDDEAEQNFARMQWIMSEHCAAARVDLEAYEQPDARTPDDILEKKRKIVAQYCK